MCSCRSFESSRGPTFGLQYRSNKEKENLVADLKIAGGSQRVGPKASQRLFALFTATDPLMPLGDLGFNG